MGVDGKNESLSAKISQGREREKGGGKGKIEIQKYVFRLLRLIPGLRFPLDGHELAS